MNVSPKSSPNDEELLSSGSQWISSTDVLSEKIQILCLSEGPTVNDISPSNSLNNLISFRNLEKSLHGIQNTNNLLQEQTDSLEVMNSDVVSRKKSSFEPSYIFRNLLYIPNNNEVEEFSGERGIFPSLFPMDVLTEDQHILREIRNVFEREGKLKNSTVQIETRTQHQTIGNISAQGNEDYDWDKFLVRWEGMHVISGSTSEAQASLTSKGRKRKNSTSNEPTKKRPCTAGSPETMLLKSSSSDEEHGSSRKFVFSSLEKEMEIIIHPISSDASETNTSSELEKIIKIAKIKLSEDDPIPPFVEKFISLDPESLPNRANDFYEVFHVDAKDIINLLTKSSETNEIDEVTSDEDFLCF